MTSMIAIARANHQMRASQSKSAIQEIHQNGLETRLAMKRGEPTVRVIWGYIGYKPQALTLNSKPLHTPSIIPI